MTDSPPTIHDLLEKFKDPTSHYHIPPGGRGPADEDDHSSSAHPPGLLRPIPSPYSITSAAPVQGGSSVLPAYGDARGKARAHFLESGFGAADIDNGSLEWPVAWGDCDMFQHVNNVTFVRWAESARIRYCEYLAPFLPDGMMRDMLLGKGIGFILRDIAVRYRAPVTYPDTVLIATRPSAIEVEKGRFTLQHAMWSLKDNRLAATAEGTLVAYDYDALRKAAFPPAFAEVLQAHIGQSTAEKE